MKPIYQYARMMTDDELDMMHAAVLEILENPGMKFENEDLLKALEKKGARVDYSTQIASLPRNLVEEAIGIAAREDAERMAENGNSPVDAKTAIAFNWHTPFATDITPPPTYSFGAGCPLFYNHETRTAEEATAQNFLDMVHLAEGIPEVASMGNPVHYIRDFDGSKVTPKMISIKGAALVAKHSSKPGSTALMYADQLEYLIEIGRVIRGSWEEYRLRPILINLNDTMTPLRLSVHEGKIVHKLAEKRLPVSILPMPLLGMASPITPVGSAIVGAAEILGVWVAAKAVSPDVPVEGICCSGTLEPTSGSAMFSGPETIMIDIICAQLFRRRYNVRCGTALGIIDSPAPGTASAFERCFKMTAAAAFGEFNYPVGILSGGTIFSPEQVMLDLDMGKGMYRLFRGSGGDDELSEVVDLVREVGIGGTYLSHEHTAEKLRDNIVFFDCFPRTKSTNPADIVINDPVEKAHELYKKILSETPLYEVDADKRKEIDRIVKSAEENIDHSDTSHLK